MKRLLILMFAITACGPQQVVVVDEQATGLSVRETFDAMTEIDEVFVDDLEIAFATGRGSLAPVIQSLQKSLREIEAIEASSDIPSHIWRHCVNRFSLTTDAFIAFLGQAEDNEVSSLFDRAEAAQDNCIEWFGENLED